MLPFKSYTEFHSFNGTVIVERAIELDEPVIYVSVNYRSVQFDVR